MSKKKDLCRAVAMISDAETLFIKAFDAYEAKTAFQAIQLSVGRAFLIEFQALTMKWDKELQDLYRLSGLDIMTINYEDKNDSDS